MAVNFYNQIILKQDQKIVESKTLDFNSSDELLRSMTVQLGSFERCLIKTNFKYQIL